MPARPRLSALVPRNERGPVVSLLLAHQAKAAHHRLRLVESIGMGMAAASDEADFGARNQASSGSCTTDPPASDKAESLSGIKGKHGLPSVEEVFMYTPGTPAVGSTGAADD